MWGGEGVTFCANISTKWIATSIRFLREKEKLRETGSFGAQPPEEKDRQTGLLLLLLLLLRSISALNNQKQSDYFLKKKKKLNELEWTGKH